MDGTAIIATSYPEAVQEALASGDVREDTPVLVMEGATGVLALLTRQMCYHHLAQGEMAGEPWMVSF